MSSQSASTQASPLRPRFEVEIYAHALKARLELASFKAINGLGETNIDDLEKSAELSSSTRAVAPSPWQPSRPVLAEKSHVSSPSKSTSAAMVDPSSTPELPSISQQSLSSTSTTTSSTSSSSASTLSGRAQRSIYTDIFGKEFGLPSRAVSTSPTKVSASSCSIPSSPSRRRLTTQGSPASSRYTGTSALLDKAASSPQLGSPERRNGRFDWHNNPSAEMKAGEEKLATSGHTFEIPTISPTKRVRLTSAAGALLASPSRARMHSHGSASDNGQVQFFLSNGHPASSLAQGFGINAPRTPRSRHNSAFGRPVMPQPFQHHQLIQDQEERDRVANTLAMMAEDRAVARASEYGSGSSGTSSGGDAPHPMSRSTMLGTPRKGGFVVPGSITPVRAGSYRAHRRNVSWADTEGGSLSDGQHRPRSDAAVPGARPKTPDRRIQEDDEGAAHYLLYLASSPSHTGVSRSRARFEGATPSLHPLRGATTSDAIAPDNRDRAAVPFADDGRDEVDQDSPGAAAKRNRDGAGNLPITPPPSGRARHQRNPLEPLDGATGDDAHMTSPPSTPPRTAARLPHALADALHAASASNLYGWSAVEAGPKTPPPLTQPHTPQAPGSDFSYADFVNVSPSPKPRSVRRTPGTSGRAWTDAYGLHRAPTSGSGADGTPSRGTTSRSKFLDYDVDNEHWSSEEWNTTLTPGPRPARSRTSSTASSIKDAADGASARGLGFE